MNSDSKPIQYIYLKYAENVIPAKISDICAVITSYRSTLVFMEDGRWGHHTRSLKFFEKALDSPEFMKISRQAIINLTKVRAYRKTREGSYTIIFGNSFPETITIRQKALNSILSEDTA
ncbi:MAG: LytTR family transcriptional regulator DNA-binding domain-containing protein [Bacteroidales bacterium]|nr:LytTR family transcriptional regulator DNA-binding domain-containing protein [Bacteroidales bacterium]